MAAIVLSAVSAAHGNPLCAKAVDAFVNAKCPAIKYKQLLLPEHGGSFDRAKRHFSDLKASTDPIVAALAAERDFLCSYIEHQYTAPPKKAARNLIPEIPYHALVQLRFIFKSLSIRIKKATARNEAELVLARSWYSDHMIIAQSFVQQRFVEQAALVMRGPTPTFVPQNQDNKRRKTQQASLPAPTQPPAFSAPPATQTSGGPIDIPKQVRHIIKPGLSAAAAQQAIAKHEKQHEAAFKLVFSRICRNCFAAGKGLVDHKINECRKFGNPCVLNCPRCQAGKHWIGDCPKMRNQFKN